MAVAVIMTVTVNFTIQGGGPVAPLGSMIRLISRPQDGGMLVWDITREKASQLPRWDPAAAPVPLSTADAASRAQAWLREHHPDAPPLELTTAMLSRVRRGGDIDFWIYQLDFFSYNGPYSLRRPYSVVVLPDGTVVDPRIEPPPSADARASATAAEIELPPGVVRIGPGVIGPRLIHEERPRYTTAAMGQRIQGSVLLEGIVETDGSVSNVRVVRSLDANYGLDNEALIAARKWRFSPGIKDGHPVRVLVTMEMTFTLRK